MALHFVSIDLETASSEPDSICEIGLAKFREGVLVDTYQSIIQPEFEFYLEGENAAIHGISIEQIEAAPYLAEVWADIRNFIGEDILVAHSATNDMKKIITTLEGSDLDTELFEADYLCTEVASRNSNVIQAESYSLDNLVFYLGLNRQTELRGRSDGRHGALEDAILCGELLLRILEGEAQTSVEALTSHLGLKLGQARGSKLIRGCTKAKFANNSDLNSEQFRELQDDVWQKFQVVSGHPLQGKSILLTLSLESMTEPEFNRACAMVGAIVKTGVSKKLDYLVEGIDPTGKYQTGTTGKSKKARELNESQEASIAIIREPEFKDLITASVIDSVKAATEQKIQDAKSPQQVQREKRLEKSRTASEKKMQSGEQLKAEFLANPHWSQKVVSKGDIICFTQIVDIEKELELESKAKTQGVTTTKSVNKQLNLLVIADGHEVESAKLRNALLNETPVTTLSIFLETNPAFKTKKKWFGF